MSSFKQIIALLPPDSRRSRMSEEEAQTLRVAYPKLPAAYFRFLKEVGWGDLTYVYLFGGPVEPSDIYRSDEQRHRNLLLFGDNFCGYFFAFDLTNECRVVELEPNGNPLLPATLSFDTFMLRSFNL